MSSDEAADELESIVRQMRCGDFSASSEMILLARDEETGAVTICRWGDGTGLLQEAAALKRPSA